MSILKKPLILELLNNCRPLLPRALSGLRWYWIYIRYTAFIRYVHHFYRPDWMYPYAFTVDEIVAGLHVYLRRQGTIYSGDSIDRENVRDIIFGNRGEI